MRSLRGYDQCMQQATGPDHWETPWGAGPWRWGRYGGGPPRGARWFPVVFSLLVQSVVVAFSIAHAAAPAVIMAAVAAMAGSFALLAVRRWPGPSVAVIALATFPAIFFTTLPLPIALPLVFAMVVATARGARAWVWSVASASLLLSLVLAFAIVGRPVEIVRPLVATLVLSALIGIGETARNRRERFAEFRAATARRRQSEAERERVRIARELHDVLAHSLSSINVQAGVGLHLIDEQPEKAAEALANIKQTSKSALEEVRGVLGFLRSTGDSSGSADEASARVPQPDLANLPALIESATALGVHVTLLGQPPSGMAQLAELAVYRVIQEALTNISRHSTAKNASVAFVYEDDALTVTILDDGTRPASDSHSEEERGLLGMQERAAILGGSIDAGWVTDGGFRVRLRLPNTAGADK